ncbi:ParB/RepB/Spo0J family partition protein [Streptomyces sp. NPDC058739]|uniref:ParB/RepB/Spo0J family partition protein n=1 Tax=Streptomyces sp. NPDC058739 TaxID=3346618 RepID=UPI0036AA3318
MTSTGHAEDVERDVLGHIAQCQRTLERAPVVMVQIAALATDGLLRLAGVDEDHVSALAESDTPFPPITVHQETMRVIDGVHRLMAAQSRGLTEIAVRFFRGGRQEAFVLSVAANTQHGLPLSRADRLIAAERILAAHPEWSDRAIASVSGLSAKKVGEIRRDRTASADTCVSRVGIDGRARPVNRAAGRELAGQLIRANPGASLRQIARAAGVSPSTVSDVRDRLRQGQDPVPVGVRRDSVPRERQDAQAGDHGAPKKEARSPGELLPLFDALCKDPSLRFSETGRVILRMFDSCAAASRERSRILDSMPAHCREQVTELLLGYAEMWRGLALELRQDPGVLSREAI